MCLYAYFFVHWAYTYTLGLNVMFYQAYNNCSLQFFAGLFMMTVLSVFAPCASSQMTDTLITATPTAATVTPSPTLSPAGPTTVQTVADYPTEKAISSWPTGRKLIALTFDDGPHPTITPKMIELLTSKNAKGTFFCLGRSLSAYPTVAQKYLTQPCAEVANHTWTHPQLTKCTADKIKSELQRTNEAAKNATGKMPVLMRPPYGSNNARSNSITREVGLIPITWSIDTNDWRKRSPEEMTAQILNEASDGSIILMHDRYESVLPVVSTVIDKLRAQGYSFVTVSEMLSYPRITPVRNTTASNRHAKVSAATTSKSTKAPKGKTQQQKQQHKKRGYSHETIPTQPKNVNPATIDRNYVYQPKPDNVSQQTSIQQRPIQVEQTKKRKGLFNLFHLKKQKTNQ